ncbi:MAG: ATP synthase F1 subunit gamma [Candidatus Omnitrophica bacterium]|nr:ATP synthase F1 subunit gamma [Candidatus Omnitrophota bacterium]
MIQSFRQLKDRIKSIESTRKITRAMEMVSAAKLNKVKSAFFSSKNYFARTERILFDLLSDLEPADHPLLEKRKAKNAIALAVIASDTGLCSTYNNNVIKLAKDFADRFDRERVKIIAVGKEAFSYFKKENYGINNFYLGMRGKFSEEIAADMTGTLVKLFTGGEADEIYIAYTHFSPNLRHKPVVEKFLDIEYAHKEKRHYILEPDKEAILNELISKYLADKIRVILLDSFTTEHSARMLAMKLATDNANELIDTLTLLKNKARQAAITKEVLEIANSAEALRG